MAEHPKAPPRVLGDLHRSALTAFAGDSITIWNGGAGAFGGGAFPTISCGLSGGIIGMYINAGISGNTSAQLRARLDTDVINAKTPKPGHCVVLIGTNDVTTGSGISYAQSMVNIGAIYDRLRAANIEPIGATIPPKQDSQHIAIGALNRGIRHLCDARGMHCLDFHAALVDGATGNYLSGYTVDGTHPSPTGVRAMAGVVVRDLVPAYRQTRGHLCQTKDDAANLIVNPFFIGDSNSDGLADWWTLTAQDGTVTPTIETGDANILGNWQVLTTTVAGQRVLSQNALQSATSPAGWADGDILEFTGLVTTSGIESGLSAPSARVRFPGPAIIYQAFYQLTLDVTRLFFHARFAVPTGAALNNCVVEFRNSELTPRGTGVYKIAQASLYNLTRLGVA